jgi:hypothetical protein
MHPSLVNALPFLAVSRQPRLSLIDWRQEFEAGNQPILGHITNFNGDEPQGDAMANQLCLSFHHTTHNLSKLTIALLWRSPLPPFRDKNPVS